MQFFFLINKFEQKTGISEKKSQNVIGIDPSRQGKY